MPISAVHPIFTAAIIHLLHLKMASPDARSEAMRYLDICIKCLYEMNTNWDWANRSIRAIRSLAEEWEVDIWTSNLADEISEENRRQYDLYERGCVTIGQRQDVSSGEGQAPAYVGETFDEVFHAWMYDQNLSNMPFNFFDEV